ncbi:MAG: serine hydrolase [Phycisphaerales bacterium]|nr:serine hydrolase [Phycisphaerales bacterium]
MLTTLQYRKLWLTTFVPLCAALPVRADNAADLANAQALVADGHFADADAIIAPHIVDANAPITEPFAILREQMRRTLRDYRLSPEEMLEKLRLSIPDVTAGDMERWRTSGELQHRVIDGKVRYFAREPGNLFRTSAEAKARRRTEIPPTRNSFDNPRHVQRLVERAAKSDSPEVYPVHHRATYTLSVNPGNPRVMPGAKVRCWLPYPQEYRQQKDVHLIATDPPGGSVAPANAPQRTVYFEHEVTSADEPLSFSATYEFTTSAYCPMPDPAGVKPYDKASDIYREYTAERAPHIVFTPKIKRVVEEVVGDETNPLIAARKIFRWMDANIPWCAEVEYSTIFNISDKGITARRGDCGVQGLTFITLCRAAGIPARWQSGWETRPISWNMHDWTEFYVEPWGWLPADPSYGLQNHYDPRVRDFYCGNLDPYRMIVNLDYGRELHPPKTSFRSEPYDFQRGEVEIDGHNLYFDEWSYRFDFETQPLDRSLDAAAEMLDAVVPGLLAAEHIPGAVIAIGRRTADGFETWEGSYGYQQIEPKRVPMPVDAIFDMASMTKPIATGTSLMQLIEQGKVNLDDPVSKYLPEFASGDKQHVTIKHLMTHMSGEIPYIGAPGQKKIREANGFPCRAAMRQAIRDVDLARAPGEMFSYSCLNAILSAEILEKVSGEPLDQYSAEHVFKPLGMKDTGFNPPRSLAARFVPTTRADHAQSADGFLRGEVHDPMAAMQDGVSGNAGLFSGVADLERFAEMMLNGGELDGVRILKPDTVKEMTSVQNPGATNAKGVPARRGLLWDTYPPDAGATGIDALYAYGHTGYTGTAIRIYPDAGMFIIALTNRVHPDDTGKVSDFRNTVWHTVGNALLGE